MFKFILPILTCCSLAQAHQAHQGHQGHQGHEKLYDTRFSPAPITEVQTGPGEVVLTFDDGPSIHTEAVLKILRHMGLKATFFVVGNRVASYPKIMEQMAADGHVIANHTYTHNGYAGRADLLRNEILRAHQSILPFIQASGTKRLYYRAPGGAWQKGMAESLNIDSFMQQFIGPIHWNIGGGAGRTGLSYDQGGNLVMAADWACWSQKVHYKECAAGYYRELVRKQGGIILMHDLSRDSVEMFAELLRLMVNGGRDGLGNGQWRAKTLDELNSLRIYEI